MDLRVFIDKDTQFPVCSRYNEKDIVSDVKSARAPLESDAYEVEDDLPT